MKVLVYVLMIYVGGFKAGGPAMHDFDDKIACEAAAAAFTAKLKANGYSTYWTCEPKSYLPPQ